MLYVIEHAPGGDVFRTFDGMSQGTVSALMDATGNAYDFVSEVDFKTAAATAGVDL